MARKIRAREVLRLLESGMSRNAVARSQGMSKHGVQAVSEAAEVIPSTYFSPSAQTNRRRSR